MVYKKRWTEMFIFFCVSNKKSFSYILYKIEVIMIIIDNISEQISVKLPNNLVKSSGKIYLKNTETKKEYIKEFEDESTSDLYYVWTYTFSDIPIGEYEYVIDGNKGLLRIGKEMEKKVYDEEISFKSYEG